MGSLGLVGLGCLVSIQSLMRYLVAELNVLRRRGVDNGIMKSCICVFYSLKSFPPS